MNLVRRFVKNIYFLTNFIVCTGFVFRGYYPRGGGEVRITVNPVDQLVAADLTDFGQIKRFFGRAFVSGTLPKRVAMLFNLRIALCSSICR